MDQCRWNSATAEIAAWDIEGRWHQFEYNHKQTHPFRGCFSANQVAEFISFVASNTLVVFDEPEEGKPSQ